MQHDRLVIAGGSVLTGPPLTGEFQAVDVSVVGGRIAEIGPDLSRDGAQLIDARGTFLLPGFVDTHQHLWQTTMRGITAGWDLTDFLWGIRQHHASLFQPDDLYAGTYAGGLTSLEAGTTTTIEYAYSLNTPEHADAAIAAIRQAGIRAVWCYGLIDVPLEQPYFDSPQRRWPEVRRVRSEYFASNRRDELVTLGLGVNDLFTYPWEVTRGEYALARELDLVLTSHINSVWAPDSPPEIEWLHRDGLLGPKQVCVHATTSSDHELQLLADAGASVASTPETELQMGLGFPVFARAAAYGVNAGLGADIQANNSPDAFVRMRLGMHAESLRADLPLLAADGVSALRGVSVGPREILYHATLGGALTLGLGDVTGSLEVGKAADIILVRNDQLHHRPIVDPYATIVLQSRTSDIETVLVAGRVVKANGTLASAESARAVSLVDAAFERLDAEMAVRGGRRPRRPAGWLKQVSAKAAANAPAWPTH